MICLIMLSPTMMTFSNLARISQISSVENHRMSQPRGIYGASCPIRPPDDIAVNMEARSGHNGEKAAWRSKAEMLQVLRYL